LVKQCDTPITVVSVAVDERFKADAESIAEQVRARMAEEGITVKTDVRAGRPDEEIVAATTAVGSDLIVMGSHGRTGLDRLLVGSDSERVIGRADCSVMVIEL
jgi:nucleotide-binding universal stress UspA family protein